MEESVHVLSARPDILELNLEQALQRDNKWLTVLTANMKGSLTISLR